MESGKKEEKLLNLLKKLDACTAVDKLLKPGQQVTITATNRNGKLRNWHIMEDTKAYKSPAPQKGSSFEDLMKNLQAMSTEETITENLDVLCYKSTKVERTWDGKISSEWFVISPGVPYELDGDHIVIPTVEFVLSEPEYRFMMETRIAFYNEFTGDIYPIRQVAISSLGKFMDCAASFKYIAPIPLGSALLIAEKLSNIRNMQFVYRRQQGSLKPLIGVGGDRFLLTSQFEFFQKIFSSLSDTGIYSVKKWSVSDDLTSVEVEINDITCLFSPRLRIQTSSIPGASASVTAYAKFRSGYVFLKKNKAYHTSKLQERGETSLLSGMIDEFLSFNDKISVKQDVCVTEQHLSPIAKIIGKKRAQETETFFQIKHSGNAYEVIMDVISNTYFDLPVKQAEELAVAYNDLVSEVIEAKKA